MPQPPIMSQPSLALSRAATSRSMIRYKASEGTIRYIGEWHTHPEDFPQYSYTDFQNWKKIIQQSGIDDYHYHLIAGRKEVAVWKYSDKLKAPWILARVEWDKMNYS